jgi:hypothetical protein
MKKTITFGLVFAVSLVFATRIALAAPSNSQAGNAVEIPSLNPGETWLQLPTSDGGFQLWVTGGRELHCVYKPAEKFEGKPGWVLSSAFEGFVYKCNELN